MSRFFKISIIILLVFVLLTLSSGVYYSIFNNPEAFLTNGYIRSLFIVLLIALTVIGLIFNFKSLKLFNVLSKGIEDPLDDIIILSNKKQERYIGLFYWIGNSVLAILNIFIGIVALWKYVEKYPISELPNEWIKYSTAIGFFVLGSVLIIDMILVKRFIKNNQTHLLNIADN